MPVRGSATPGKLGFNSPSENPWTAVLNLSPVFFCAIDREQTLLQRAAVNDRHVARRIAASGNARVNLSGGDLVGDDDRVVERGAAGTRRGDSGCQRRQP